ncbi:MAG TPA: hypothetical protein PLA90_08850 [Candidatus Sumerlaeota bacterium]|nr:hypothetical protein [Candidatus Sumerlaeota bacterium]HPS01638.1 hypothetical protein [Candidatus Sumerlaeota bacterium]
MAEKKKGWLYNVFLMVMILGMGAWLTYQYAPIPESVRSRVGAFLGQSPEASREEAGDAVDTAETAVDDEATTGTAPARVAKKPSPTPPPTPKARVVANNQFQNINKLNVFDPIYTPTPTPTPPPPPAQKQPELEKALRDWQLEYYRKQKTIWHFKNKRIKDQAYDVEIGKTFTLQDGGRSFDVNIVPEGKYGVTFVYPGPPEQRKTFSVVEQ